MKKKTLALILTLCMTLTAVIGFTAGAAAAGGLQEIKAYLNSGISIKLDGEAKVLTDASGVRTYPISYNGTTYLPIRSIADLLGVEVNWDQATASVLLGKTKGVDLIDTYKYYDRSSTYNRQVQSSEKQEQEISGIACSHWLRIHQSWGSVGKGHLDHISFNILGKYDTLTFRYYSEKDVILRVLGDNDSILFEREITGGQVAQTVTIPLLKTNQIKFQTEKLLGEGSSTYGNTYVFDAYLDAEG